jgi:MarR family transcriptional regulator, organic hydroperoxide resistance regulator
MTIEKEILNVDLPIGVWMMLRRTNRLIAKSRQRELAKHDISEDASAVLFTVSFLGRQAIPATISKYLFLERHSVSQLLTRMEKDDLIRRVRDLERKNYVRIELTAKGQDAFIKSSKQRSTKPIISTLSEEEQQRLWGDLVKLRTRAIKKLSLRNPLLYPPSDRQSVIDDYNKADEKDTLSVDQYAALWMLLGRTSRLIGKARQRELAKYDVSVDASAVLFTVFTLGRQAIPATISKYLFLERHSVSQLLTRMEKDALIRRVKDLERRNYVRIELTAKGREAIFKSSKQRSTRPIMAALTSEEQQDLWALLAKLRDRALKRLGLKSAILFPPSDPRELLSQKNKVFSFVA